jgi:IS30 family transposase
VTDEIEEVQRVRDALQAVMEIPDEVTRARAISTVFREFKGWTKQAKPVRDTTVRSLKAVEGTTVRAIAQRIGVTHGTVQDILRGHSGTWVTRPKKATQEPPPDAES